jgi:myo-inositol catabolism protein IolC
MTDSGSNRPLHILPFDHRGSFQTKMFGWKGMLIAEQTAEIAAAKQVIDHAFKAAVHDGVAEEKAGILVDEQFGAAIIRDAGAVEKSGQDEFDFEYGDDFAKHIDTFRPTFSKVLVRYNPERDRNLNAREAARLKRLSDYLTVPCRGSRLSANEPVWRSIRRHRRMCSRRFSRTWMRCW